MLDRLSSIPGPASSSRPRSRVAVLVILLAGLPLLLACGSDADLSVRILTTASDPDVNWVDVSGNTDPPPSNCTIPDDFCSYDFDPQTEELFLVAMGDPFGRWECSSYASLQPLRTSFERGIGGFVDKEQCAAIFCPTRDVILDVDVGIAGANARVRINHPQNTTFLVKDGRVRFEAYCESVDSTCFARVCEGTTLEFAAVEDTLDFVGFDVELECGVPVAGDPLRSRLLVDDHKSCTATFAALQLEVSVTGNGRVVSTSGGIDCSAVGEAACVRPFPLNRRVDLLAQADPGASFVAWGGDCSGTTETAQIRIEENRQCIAEFDALAVAPGEPGVLELASIAPGGGGIPNLFVGGATLGFTGQTDLSADGRSVVFPRAPESDPATGQPIPGPDNGILLRNLAANVTEHLVSANEFYAEGKQYSVSADGRYLAFVSGDPDLTGNLPGDLTQAAFVYDRVTQELDKVSVDDALNSVSLRQIGFVPAVLWAEISANGRYVVFAGVSQSEFKQGIYVRDTCAGAPCIPHSRIVSVNADGAVPIQGSSGHPSISADGRFVAFRSTSTLLVPGGLDLAGGRQVFVHDRDADGNGRFDETGSDCSEPPCLATTPISVPGDGFSYPRISDSGRFVAYAYSDTGLATEYGGSTSFTGVLVYDTVEETTRGLFGDATIGSAIGDPDFSGDGRFIAFSTENLQTAVQDTCFGAPDGCAPKTHLISVNAAGEPADGLTSDPHISGDGRLASFGGIAWNLLPEDVDNDWDIYVAASGFARTPGGRPEIDDLPANLQAGSPEQLIPVDGSGFVPGASVVWDGEPRTTVYINETRLQFRVTADDLALPKRVPVRVRNPGGGEAGPVRLEVLE